MRAIRANIFGTPYSKNKPRGDVKKPDEWTSVVIEQTKHLGDVDRPCLVRVTFRLPPDKYPLDHPHGSDLDNLLKRFFDALGSTIFKNAPGKDGIIVSIEAKKVRVDDEQDAGADLEVIEIIRESS